MATEAPPKAPLRVRRVEIRKLFGLYDHDIDLNTSDGVTILHGPNGVGKTATLHLLMVLAGHYEALWKYPLERLKFTFDSEEYVLFDVESKNNFDGTWFFQLSLDWGHGEQSSGKCRFRKSTLSFEGDEFKGFKRSAGVREAGIFSVWMNGYKNHARNWLLLREYTLNGLMSGVMNGLSELYVGSDLIGVFFVNTHRLLYLDDSGVDNYSMVNKCSGDIVSLIQERVDAYDSMTRQGDQTFLKRLLELNGSKDVDMERMGVELIGIEAGIAELQKIGVLSELIESNFRALLNDIKAEQFSTVRLYVEDMNKKLSVFDDVVQRVNLFCCQLNLKLNHKSISVHAEDGLVVRDMSGERLPLEALSSGEQHQIVLLYELLFRTKPGTLVLIDEPELSLHLSWQKRFLDDLLEVVKVTGIDVLMATHSPFIVGDRDDLMVALSAEPTP